MKKIIKTSLLIIGFCLLLVLLSDSKVQATEATISTMELLNTYMYWITQPETEQCFTIDGTTLTITNDCTWKLEDYAILLEIPELTIDFNGNKVNIETKYTPSIIINKGKVILKDSTGEKGGFYDANATNTTISVNRGAELVIENGRYIVEKGTMLANKGGNITIKNGTFKSNSTDIFNLTDGNTVIDDGDITGSIFAQPSEFVHLESSMSIEINGGNFMVNSGDYANLLIWQNYGPLTISLNGGRFSNDNGPNIRLDVGGQTPVSLKLDGCTLDSGTMCLDLFGSMYNYYDVGELAKINIVNATLKKTGSNNYNCGAIFATSWIYDAIDKNELPILKYMVSNYDRELFETISRCSNNIQRIGF